MPWLSMEASWLNSLCNSFLALGKGLVEAQKARLTERAEERRAISLGRKRGRRATDWVEKVYRPDILDKHSTIYKIAT